MIDLRASSYAQMRASRGGSSSTPSGLSVSSGGGGGGSSSSSAPVFSPEQYYKDTHSIDTSKSTIQPVTNEGGQIVGASDTVKKQSVYFASPVTQSQFREVQRSQIANDQVIEIAEAQARQAQPQTKIIRNERGEIKGIQDADRKQSVYFTEPKRDRITEQPQAIKSPPTRWDAFKQGVRKGALYSAPTLPFAESYGKGLYKSAKLKIQNVRQRKTIKEHLASELDLLMYDKDVAVYSGATVAVGSAVMPVLPALSNKFLVNLGIQTVKGQAITKGAQRAGAYFAPDKYKKFYEQEGFKGLMTEQFKAEEKAINEGGFFRKLAYNINPLFSDKKSAFINKARDQAMALGYTDQEAQNFIEASLRARQYSAGGEAIALFDISRGVERYGRRGIAKSFKKAGERGVSWVKGKGFWEVSKLTAPTLAKAGFIEGFSQQLAQDTARYSDKPFFDKEDFKPNKENLLTSIPAFRSVRDYIKKEPSEPKSRLKGAVEMGGFGSLSATVLGVPIAYFGTVQRKGAQKLIEYPAMLGDLFEKPADLGQDAVEIFQRRALKMNVPQPSVVPIGSGRVAPTMTFKGSKLNANVITPTLAGFTPSATQSPAVVKQKKGGGGGISPTKTKGQPKTSVSIDQLIDNIVGGKTTKTTKAPIVSITPSGRRRTITPTPISSNPNTQTQSKTNNEVVVDDQVVVDDHTATDTITETNEEINQDIYNYVNTNTNTNTQTAVGVPTVTPLLRAPPPFPLLFPDFSSGGGKGSKSGKRKAYVKELSYSRELLKDFLPVARLPQRKTKKIQYPTFSLKPQKSLFPTFKMPTYKTKKPKKKVAKHKKQRVKETPFSPLPQALKDLIGF